MQEGAIRLAVDETPPLLLVDPASLASAEAAIVAAARRPAADWIARYLFAPIEEAVLPFLLGRRVHAVWPALLAVLLAIVGGGVAWTGWRWFALLCLLLSGPIAGIAMRLTRVQARPIPFEPVFAALRLVGAASGATGLAAGLAKASGQWGWWLVAGIVLAMMVALDAACRLRDRPSPLWIASSDVLIWAMLPFAAFGWWGIGLGGVAAYAGLSFAWIMGSMVKERQKID